MSAKGLWVKTISDDGNCLFRSVSDQVYGDPNCHSELRKMCLDYMVKNRGHFSQFTTEDFEAYILRKRCLGVDAGNPEIQALSEMFARPIEVYSYSSRPVNTFVGNMRGYLPPIRISCHRNNHYNSLRSFAEEGGWGQVPLTENLTQQQTSENQCFLCGQACSDYEDVQIHMFTSCPMKDLL